MFTVKTQVFYWLSHMALIRKVCISKWTICVMCICKKKIKSGLCDLWPFGTFFLQHKSTFTHLFSMQDFMCLSTITLVYTVFDTPNSFFSLLPNAFNAVVHAAGDLHQPALLMPLSERSLIHLQRNPICTMTDTIPSILLHQHQVWTGNDLVSADLCDHTNTTRNDSCFGLSSTHPTQARGHKHTARQVTRAQVPPAGVQHSQLHRKTGRQQLHIMYTINVLHRFCSPLKFHVP